MPSVHRAAKVPIAEAGLLANYYGIEADLRSIEEWCSVLNPKQRKLRLDFFIEDAVATASVVRYARCFATGIRFRLTRDDIVEIGDELLHRHDYFVALRDRHLAHAVNAYDEDYVTIGLTENDEGFEIGSQLHPGYSRLLLGRDETENLLKLVSAVREVLRPIIAKEETRVLEIIHSLPKDIVKEWELHTPTIPEENEVRKPRGRAL